MRWHGRRDAGIDEMLIPIPKSNQALPEVE